jgi:hypothetical protein
MAKSQNTNSAQTRSFDKDLNKDISDFHSAPNSWTYARNAVPNSITGDLGDLGNEISNRNCINAPYTIIGTIHIASDLWAIFSTNNIDSEIGLFTESLCTYSKIVNDQCLNFNKANLITGEAREGSDCDRRVYWSDQKRNPDRVLNIDNVPWIQNCVDENGNPPTSPLYPVGCITCTPTTSLNCDEIRLAKLMLEPCIDIKKGVTGGSLLNGSYFVTIAYLIEGQRVTDYSTPSDIQPLFEHENVAGALEITISGLDQTFDEYELVVISVVNQQTQVKRFGVYNTRQNQISIDIIDNKLVDVPIEFIPQHNAIIERSEAISRVGNDLLRINPSSKFDFNYQSLANQIIVKWQSVEYPADYYVKGGNQTSYMRDEVYPFFIQFQYSDGEYSSSYHIPGRIAGTYAALGLLELAPAPPTDSIYTGERVFEAYNTATVSNPAVNALADDGVGLILSEGYMGYWESTEKYPDDKFDVWGSLCGKQIRHHKFPEQSLHSTVQHYFKDPGTGKVTIRLMGVKFENISPPVDNQGNPITNIVGYRILRGSREGNKTIIAKGMINNMFEYDIEGGITGRQGLYPNYPYNDLSPDQFISTTDTTTGSGTSAGNPNPSFREDVFTFHSPDTQFRNPFLSAKELKRYGTIVGQVDGQFIEPDKHPKHKLITDLTFFLAAIGGFGISMLAIRGKRNRTVSLAESDLAGPMVDPATATASVAGSTAATVYNGVVLAGQAALTLGELVTVILGTSGANDVYMGTVDAATPVATAFPGVGIDSTINFEESAYSSVPALLQILQGVPTFTAYWADGTDSLLRLVQDLLPYRQYALQYQSHCEYDLWENIPLTDKRRLIDNSNYLSNQFQDFGANFRVNNLFRGRSVAVDLFTGFSGPSGDNSKKTVGGAIGLGPSYSSPKVPFNTVAKSYYTALKLRLRNQYGQIGGVQQIPISCVNHVVISATPQSPFSISSIMGGDTYVTRYTEKNTMFFFYEWLMGQPDGFEFDYHNYKYIPYPRYWINTTKFDTSTFISGLVGSIGTILSGGGSLPTTLPSQLHTLDKSGAITGLFQVKDAFFYLFNSGVRDFYVESDVNTDLRDWGDNDTERHYDQYRGYTDLPTMFNTSIIKSGNFFKYDYSLSIAKLFPNFISWASVQPINYDPTVYETCYTENPNRINYSLPQQIEAIKDNWRVFLPNNYKDFTSPVTTVKAIDKSGAMILFETESPIMLQGSETLETDLSTKLTIGDGVLFDKVSQNILNSDAPYEYGSCQNARSVISTPAGLYWMSQNQGKIFMYGGGVKEISNQDLKWWLAEYLPYKLTQLFPSFELVDNPVIGIGCQSIYDNENGLLYFSKKDYTLRDDAPGNLTYVSGNIFLNTQTNQQIFLGNPLYFEDASWTLSYDPKTGNWISFHDWHPNLLMPGKNTFMSILDRGVWIHNDRCDSYCNFYGVDYPFEIEYRVNTVQEVDTLRSVESQVEVYKYAPNCTDRYLYLEEFFDEAVVHNQEQVSGILRLNLTPYNDPYNMITYPRINFASMDILYSKVEGKYRFDMFDDITDDRGQFTNARRMIWNTGANGYVRVLNPLNLNYQKTDFQRKKIRGYNTLVLLRRLVSGDRKFLVLLSNNKNLYSPR